MFQQVVKNILVKRRRGNSESGVQPLQPLHGSELQALHRSEVETAFAASSLVLYASFVHEFQDNAPEAIGLLELALVSCLRVCLCVSWSRALVCCGEAAELGLRHPSCPNPLRQPQPLSGLITRVNNAKQCFFWYTCAQNNASFGTHALFTLVINILKNGKDTIKSMTLSALSADECNVCQLHTGVTDMSLTYRRYSES